MTRSHKHRDHRREDADRRLTEAMAQPVAGPDLTRRIMGRLGYMQVSRRIARRRALERWAGRAALTAVAAVALGLGLRVYQSSPELRRPSGPTIPDALSNDLQRQQHRIGNVIRTIRTLSPQRPSDAPAESADPCEPPSPPAHNEDVNEWSIAPMRWV